MIQDKRFYLRSADVGKAARYAYTNPLLAARPVSWRNSGYALVSHGGFFYRVRGNDNLETYQIPVSELIEQWEVVRRSQLQEELDGTFKAQRQRKRKFHRPDRSKGSGRPSTDEVTALFKGMLCIDDAAKQADVANHSLRRAILANKLPWMKQHGVYLVTLEDVKAWRDGPRGPRNRRQKNVQSDQA